MSAPHARTLKIYFGTAQQMVKFFEGSSREDILAGIREVIAAPPDAQLRFRDEDGDVVLISSAMPSGTVLHVSMELGIPFQGSVFLQPPAPMSAAASLPSPVPVPVPAVTSTAASPRAAVVMQMPVPVPAVASQPDPSVQSVEWRFWHRAEGGQISREGLQFDVSDDGATNGFAVYSAILPKTGKHYVVLEFSKRLCCLSLGFLPATMGTLPNKGLISDVAYPHMVSLKGIGESGDSFALVRNTHEEASELDIGIFIDVDHDTAVLLPHGAGLETAVRMDLSFTGRILALVGPKHYVSCRIRRCELPADVPVPNKAFDKRLEGAGLEQEQQQRR